MKNIFITLILASLSIIINAQVDKSFSTLEEKSVLKRLFDNAEFNSNGEILWKPNYSEAINNQVSDDNFCHTNIDTIMYYRENNYDNAIVIFTTYKYKNGEKESCHACSPTFGIATFERSINTNWELKQFEKNLMHSGIYGEPDKLFLTKIGKEKFCLSRYNRDLGFGRYNDFIIYQWFVII